MKRTLISVLLILTALYMSAGSVTPPQDLVTDTYYADAHCFYIEPTGIPLYYKVEIGFQDNDVYIKGLFPVCPNDWVKGTIRDNEIIMMLTYIPADRVDNRLTSSFLIPPRQAP